MATEALLDDDAFATEVIIGLKTKKLLILKIPLFISDMSFGSLSKEANTALAIAADSARTGICSGAIPVDINSQRKR